MQIGLARSGGQPLPQAVLAKMEAAFGADFSAVRVHVGPQAPRIGAVAFTMGNDLYFAPGRFQPDSAQGQQLIGHELAHVVQQRQGRVRAPGSGVAVVQDRVLEAEADRLGLRAALHRFPVHGARSVQPQSRCVRLGQDLAVQPSASWMLGLGLTGALVGGWWAGGVGLTALGLGMVGAAVGRQFGGADPPRAEGHRPRAPDPRTADLSVVAAQLNTLHEYRDTATHAVAERADGTFAVYTQRGYDSVRECAEVLRAAGIPEMIDFVEADGTETEYNIHAEMLAVSEWLLGNHPKPVRIGASRGICLYCNRVLTHLGVRQYNVEGHTTKSWVNPWWLKDRVTPATLAIPRYRRYNRDYP
ncbi:DUF4157 domain-containing protein [Phenylobacterium sp.]|uniref:eCIS core domain-containing protein n=1 Tax=Phenylobacterium sp. TaxID=1871053 RepID=UPI003D2D6063